MVEDDEGDDLPEETKRRKLRIAEVYDDQEGAPVSKPVERPLRMVPEVVITTPRKNIVRPVEEIAPPKPDEKLYRLRAPVQEEGAAKRLAKRILDGELTFRARDIVGVSNEVREEVRRSLTKVRKPMILKPPEAVLWTEEGNPFPPVTESVMQLGNDALSVADLPRVEHIFITQVARPGIPAGSVVVPDAYEQYIESLGPGEAPRPVFAAKDSETLKVVYPMVHGVKSVESVLDSGSQIVSMAYALALEFGIVWDPDIQIYMQSANGALEKSIGLAKNVSFQFGDITLFLQVHIIDGPAYKILLGRPFEVLTESQFKNKSDGSQIITLTDPANGNRVSMSTLNRGSKRATVETVVDEDDQPAKTADTKNPSAGFHLPSMI